jgi:formylglycine-generating enzyme required for sulfatase activity
MAETVAYKYRAFISYSHADTLWAKWLHRALEGFRINKDLVGRETSTGTIPKSLRPIFRDRDDFTAGQTLTDQTLAVLDASNALIVICSPPAAKSDYVTEEIRLFKSRHPDRPVIPLIVGGKPGDEELECFPPALRSRVDAEGQITDEPIAVLAADAREEGDGKNLALAKVVAGLLGVSSDDIYRRAERERRTAARRRRRVQFGFGALGWLLLVGLVGWINQDYLLERWRWFTTIRPYMMSEFRPHVLTAAAEQALKPKDTFRECAKDCPEMVVVPADTFTMGSPPEEKGSYDSEQPQHEVTFAKPFAVSKFEVTFDDWDACVAYGDCPRASDSGWGRGRRPVINVSWDDTKRYVAWLSRMTGKTYRLLPEAEWEYAARAGTRTYYSFSNEEALYLALAKLGEYAWYDANAGEQTHPVGEKKPNGFGLYDMHGNVWEWVEDCVHENYDGAPQDGTAWIAGGDCNSRILRGGGFDYDPRFLRSAVRNGNTSDNRGHNLGFRIGRTLGE